MGADRTGDHPVLRVRVLDVHRGVAALADRGIELSSAVAATARDGYPVLIGPDGTPDGALNAYLRLLPGRSGVSSKQSLHTEAQHLAVFARWFAERTMTVWDATPDDVAEFIAYRKATVAMSTWSGDLQVVCRLYVWGVEKGYCERVPVAMRARTRRVGGTTVTDRVPVASQASPGPAHLRYLTGSEFDAWIREGVGRLPARSAGVLTAFAVTAHRTGARRAELSAVLKCDVDRACATDGPVARLWLAEATCKYHSARHVFVPARAVARLRSYERFGRAEAIEKARAAGRYNGSHWVHAHELRSHADSYTAVLGSGDRVRLDSLDAAMRRRLLWSPDGQPEPLAFFLTQQGVPVADEGLWNYYFRAASRVYNRDREVADHMWVTPHMLRHSMATSLLGYLCDALLSADPDELADPANVVLARHVYDPVRELMRLLGHRRLESTYRYVHTLRRNQDAVAATVSKWDREMPT